MSKYLIELAEQDLANARDNLHRARCAARATDSGAEWGQSGRTLDQIIAEYMRWEAEAQEALNEARGTEL